LVFFLLVLKKADLTSGQMDLENK